MTVRTDILSEELTEAQQVVVEYILGDYLRDVSHLKKPPYLEPGERSWQVRPARDIDTLPEVISTALQDKQKTEGTAPSMYIRLQEDISPQDTITEVITYSLLGREPWNSASGPPGANIRREWKPRVRGVFDDERKPGYKIIQIGQKFENEVVFTCWAQTNKQANKRARWFEDFMNEYRWYIRYDGIDEILFLGQQADVGLILDGTEHRLVGRPMRFYVRTERLSTISEATIRRLVIKLGIVGEG